MVSMATGTDLPLVLSLMLFFFFVSCSRFPPVASSTEVPVSVSAKAAAVQYWNRVVGSSSRPPSALLAHLTNTSPLDLTSNLNEIGVSLGDFKSLDNIRTVRGEEAEKRGGEIPLIIFYPSDRGEEAEKKEAEIPLIILLAYPSNRSSDDNRAKEVDNKAKPQGVFFRESQLTTGATMPIPVDFVGEDRHQDFLPRNIASRIPMSEDAIRKLFRIPADSSMGKAVASTIQRCKWAPSAGETMSCVTSAEDMIDYVVSSLGAKSSLTARSTGNSNGPAGGNALIGEVKAVNRGELGSLVSCHHTKFPYLMYQCHKVPKTKLYEVEILDPETKEMINLAAAICHFDTSAALSHLKSSHWSPSHAAFAALGFGPGMEVCHWILPSDMAWTAAAAE